MDVSKELALPFDPQLLQARWVVDGLDAEQLTSEALTALEAGFAGIALQQLAGLVKPTLSDLGTLPERAFAEMGLPPLDSERAADIFVARTRIYTDATMLAIVETFPAFAIRWRDHLEYWGGRKAGAYMDMAEFVHFVVDDLFDNGKLDEVGEVFQYLERQLTCCEQDVRDLIGIGFFETLQNVASHRPSGYRVFERFLGTVSCQIWREIERIWEGKSSLMDVVRAERK